MQTRYRIPKCICVTQVHTESRISFSGFEDAEGTSRRSRRAMRSIKAIGPIYIFSFTWPVPRNVSRQDRGTALVSASGGTGSRACVDPDKRRDPCGLAASEAGTPGSVRYFDAASRSREYGDSVCPSVCSSVAVARLRLLGLT